MPDYGLYQELGGTLSEADFQRLAQKAWTYLDMLTGVVNTALPGPVAEKVKRACCELVDEYAVQERGGEVANATNDGYQETYVTSGRTANQRLYDIAVRNLARTGLLYTGMGWLSPC